MNTRYTRIVTDLDLQALVDGELERDCEVEVMNSISASPDKIRRLADLIRERRQLSAWWAAYKKEI